MIYAFLSVFLVMALITCHLLWRRYLRCHRALREWGERWRLAPDLCALPSCRLPPEHPDHWLPDKGPTGHRFVPARLVRAPEALMSELIRKDF